MMTKVLDWLEDSWPIAAIVVAILVLITGLIYWAILEDREWQAYARNHHCVAVGRKAAATVVTSDGKVGTSEEQTIYRCDGGELQIR